MKWVLHTIKYHPLNISLNDTNVPAMDETMKYTYNLRFLLPVFSTLLAPENAVYLHKFTKSGALSLTIIALSNDNNDVRAAACNVISRFHYHMEAKQNSKDKALWLRFVDALCKGTSVIKDLKLNNFVTIFLARTALILTKPLDVMYVPLCRYLSARVVLNFDTVPELYTLLHSCDVKFKDHRTFVMEVLRDGLRTSSDFETASHAMSFKLIMEQFSSQICDVDMKLSILNTLKSVSILPPNIVHLCSYSGLLPWLSQIISTSLDYNFLKIILEIIFNISKCLKQLQTHDFDIVPLILSNIITNIPKYKLSDDDFVMLLKTIIMVFEKYPQFLPESELKYIISLTNCKECEYLLTYGSEFIVFDFDMENTRDVWYYVKYLTLKWMNEKM